MIKKVFLFICIISLALAATAFGETFPQTLQAGTYTLEVPVENAPWTVFDHNSYGQMLLNVASIKLTLEKEIEACEIRIDTSENIFNIQLASLERERELDLQIKDEEKKILNLKIDHLKKNQRINLFGIPEPVWFFILGGIAVGQLI